MAIPPRRVNPVVFYPSEDENETDEDKKAQTVKLPIMQPTTGGAAPLNSKPAPASRHPIYKPSTNPIAPLDAYTKPIPVYREGGTAARPTETKMPSMPVMGEKAPRQNLDLLLASVLGTQGERLRDFVRFIIGIENEGLIPDKRVQEVLALLNDWDSRLAPLDPVAQAQNDNDLKSALRELENIRIKDQIRLVLESGCDATKVMALVNQMSLK